LHQQISNNDEIEWLDDSNNSDGNQREGSVNMLDSQYSMHLKKQEDELLNNNQLSIEMREFMLMQAEESINQREQMLTVQEKTLQDKEIYLLEREETVELRELECSYREEELKNSTRPTDFVDDDNINIDDGDDDVALELEVIDDRSYEIEQHLRDGSKKLNASIIKRHIERRDSNISSTHSDTSGFECIDKERVAQQVSLQKHQMDYTIVKEESLKLREMSIIVREEALEKEKNYLNEREEQLQHDIELFEKQKQQEQAEEDSEIVPLKKKKGGCSSNSERKIVFLSALTTVQKEKNESIETRVLELKNREDMLRDRLALLDNMKQYVSSKRDIMSALNDDNDGEEDNDNNQGATTTTKTSDNIMSTKNGNTTTTTKTTTASSTKFNNFRMPQNRTKIRGLKNNTNNDITSKNFTNNKGASNYDEGDEDEINKMLKVKEDHLNSLQSKQLVKDLLETDVYKINASIKEKEIEYRNFIGAKGKLLRMYNDGKIDKDDLNEKLLLVKDCMNGAKDELKQLHDRKMAVSRNRRNSGDDLNDLGKMNLVQQRMGAFNK